MTAGQQQIETALAFLLSSLAITAPVWVWAVWTDRFEWLVIPGVAAWIFWVLVVASELWLWN